MNIHEFSDVASALYEAAVDGQGWSRALQSLVRATHVPAGVIMRHSLVPGRAVTIHAGCEVNPESQRLYEEHYGALDPWADAIGKRGGFEPGRITVATSEQLVPQAEFERTIYYNEFGRNHASAGHAAVVGADARGTSIFALTLSRVAGSEPYPVSILAPLELLATHIVQAQCLHDVCTRSRDGGPLTATLDRQREATFVVASDGLLRWSNSAGHAILDTSTLLTIRAGRLHAVDLQSHERLSTLLRQAAGLLQRNSSSPSGGSTAPIVLEAAGQRRRAWAAPLLGGGDADTHDRDGILNRANVLLVVEPAPRSREALHALFLTTLGLTPLEARLAVLLVRSPHGVDASALRLTPSSFRWHVKQLLAKTGATHQVDLVRVLASLERMS